MRTFGRGFAEKVLDRFALVRTVHHEVIDEHAAAVNRMHTAVQPAGPLSIRRSVRSVAHQRGAAGDGVPAYVLIGYPNVTRGQGLLGSKHGYVYLTDTESGPAGLSRALEITADRQNRREELLAKVRESFVSRHQEDSYIKQYDTTIGEALQPFRSAIQTHLELNQEPGSLRDSYGGEFGQRCLLARRLVESGVRFI